MTLVWSHLETLVARPLPTIWSSHTRASSSQVLGLILRYPVPSFARCEVALAKMSQQSRNCPNLAANNDYKGSGISL
jgi:hypothetical protein